MVESVKVVLRPGMVNGMLSFLDLVGTNMTTLAILSPDPHIFDEHWTPRESELLDTKLIDSGIQLPALKHLRIGTGVIRTHRSIYSLLGIAPTLVSLTLHLDQYLTGIWDTSEANIPPSNLRQLYITCAKDSDGDSYYFSQPLVHLLSHTPHLQRLSLDYELDLDEDSWYIASETCEN